MRLLSRIVTIKKISPIPNADAIEVLDFEENGWRCVIQKGKVNVGDKGVYFEVDSLLPLNTPVFDFMSKIGVTTLHTGEKGYRLKTIKLRGQVSQGLFIELEAFKETFDISEILSKESNLDEVLGVIKYERAPEISMEGDMIGFYPGHTPKTNQPRIQNMPELFEDDDLKEVYFERTMKLEGTSTSLIHWDGNTLPASHNTLYAANDKFSPWKLFNELDIVNAVQEINLNVSIQGEFMGPKIQGNIEKFKENRFFVFNIFDIDKGDWMSAEERLDYLNRVNAIIGKDNILEHAPVLDEKIQIFKVAPSLDAILAMADGPSINAKWREGDVYKSLEKVNGEYVQFKVISNKYLLKEK